MNTVINGINERSISMTNEPTKSQQLYNLMLRKGYPQEFSAMISAEFHTDFTATRTSRGNPKSIIGNY